MKNIIGITGANGVLGKYFVNKYKFYKFDIFKGNILNKKEVDEWIKKTNCKYLIHFAAKVSTKFVNKNFKKSLEVNYNGTKNLIDCIIKSKKKIWFFFASSSHVYKYQNRKINENDKTEPLTLYGQTKLLAEKYLLKKNKERVLKICIGRIFSFTDKNQVSTYLIPSLYKKLNLKKKKIVLHNLDHERDFCHIEDICIAINKLKTKNLSGVFNIGSGKSVKLIDIAKMINKKNKNLIIYKKNSLKTKLVADISKIKKIGFRPRFGIKKIIEDFKK